MTGTSGKVSRIRLMRTTPSMSGMKMSAMTGGGRVAGESAKGVLAVLGGLDLVTIGVQKPLDGSEDRQIVVDDQDSRHSRPPPATQVV